MGESTKNNGKLLGGRSGKGFVAGDPRINRNGRPKDTEADKIKKKATKQLIKEYKEALGEALPLIQPVLIKKALDGDLPSIKEINDRVMGKAEQATDITSKGNPIVIVPTPVAQAFNIDATNPETDGDNTEQE